MTEVRTRFAPSPTGYLHIGGARTALFNWLYARNHGGKFILRIEDTDKVRSTPEAIEAIIDGMSWLGLDWDEGPYFQTERLDLYKEQVQKLLDSGKAYRCYCTAEELEAERERARAEKRKPKYNGKCRDLAEYPTDKPSVVRFRSPHDGETVIDDQVKGRVVFQNSELDDLIIERSDGIPTYNFVVVVDDALMKITHIIRGDDHLNNTPRQILLYQALGYDVPVFAHLPLILGQDKARLSKRHGATSVTAYRDQGYLPDALVNYLARLGWSCGDEEIFSRQDLIKKFSLENVGKAAGVFNPEKLLWLNAHYIQNMPAQELAIILLPYLEAEDFFINDMEWLAKVVVTVQSRGKTLLEILEMGRFYFIEHEFDYDPKLSAKFFTPQACDIFKIFVREINSSAEFTHDSLEEIANKIMQEHDLKLKHIAQPLRIALTNSKVSPGIFETMEALGKEKVISRLAAASKLG